MAKYKLINKNGYFLGKVKLNGIYDESYDAGGCTVACLARSLPNDWELVQEEKLPENWCIMRTKETKQVPPNVTAQVFWLKNRQPAKWRDKQEIQQGISTTGVSTLEELDAFFDEMMRKSEEQHRQMLAERET